MLDIQLGRRNLSPIQRIAVAEKYRPIYEKMAKENLSTGGGDKKSIEYIKNQGTVKLPQVDFTNRHNPTTDKKLADMAGVSRTTYRMGAKVLNSDNEDVKNRVLSGETSISAGYKEHSPQIRVGVLPTQLLISARTILFISFRQICQTLQSHTRPESTS